MRSTRWKRALAAGLTAAALFAVLVASVERDRWMTWFAGEAARTAPSGDIVYTCPMDPSVEAHEPSKCPLCGMDLTPVTRSERGGVLYIEADVMRRAGVQFATAEIRTLRQHVVVFGKVGAVNPVLEDAPRSVETLIYGHSPVAPAEDAMLGIAIVPEPVTAAVPRQAAPGAPHAAAPITAGLPVGAVAPALPLARFTGTVVAVEPDPEESALRVRVELADPGHLLRAGMTIEIQIEIDLADRLVIPARAIMYAGSRRLVFVARGDDDKAGVELKELGVGVIDGGLAEIRSGLTAGQRVVSAGTFLLAAESRIKSSSPLWDDRPARLSRAGKPESTRRASVEAPAAPKAGGMAPAAPKTDGMAPAAKADGMAPAGAAASAASPSGGGW